MEVKASDPDSHRRDLREAIDKKDFPKWKVCIQVMSEQEAEQFKYDPFDLTKVCHILVCFCLYFSITTESS